MNAAENGTRILVEQAHLLNLLHDAVILRDTQGAIIFWNRGAERLYGWTSAEALGQNAHTLLRTRFPQPLAAIEAEVRRADHWEGELVQTRRDGT
ncbi:MAG: PAS domain-containing protein, partial [Chloroflexia bacterium]|nr:PAS domain-containing protein [Chloroflexia bacterium]